METVKLTEFTKHEFDYLAEMIHEKLKDMGYDNGGAFSFDLIVSFNLEDE